MTGIPFKEIKVLKTKKGRVTQRRFIVEGEKMVAEIPPTWRVCQYIYAESYTGRRFESAEGITVPDSRFASFSDVLAPQGVLAVCEAKSIHHGVLDGDFLLLCENLSDPGNIGTLIRTAAAAGILSVVLSSGSGEAFSPKALRASAGAALRVPIIEGADLSQVILNLKQRGVCVYAAHVRGNQAPYDVNLRKPCAILVGNEAHGLSDALAAQADALLRIPMAEGVESLNASVAGGILIYEAVRQRIQNPLA
jgi:TrmH family RNA methyltransferase